MKLLLPAAALLAFLAGCGAPQQPLEVYGTVPEFTLTAHTGATFASSKELAGKIWVVDFIFTNCQGPCPRMTTQMGRVQAATESLPDVRLVSITVDPDRDTPEALAAYAKRNHAGPRWTFLTGPQTTLHKLKREVFLLGNIDGQLNHSTRFVLVDQKGQIRAFYDTSEPDSISRVIADIQRLAKNNP